MKISWCSNIYLCSTNKVKLFANTVYLDKDEREDLLKHNNTNILLNKYKKMF